MGMTDQRLRYFANKMSRASVAATWRHIGQHCGSSVDTDELLVEREKNHMLQEEVETTLKDLQSM